MSEEDLHAAEADHAEEVFDVGTPIGSRADESDVAKRKVVPLASVDDSDVVDAHLA